MTETSAQISLKQLQFKGHWFRAEKWYTRATQLICFILPCVWLFYFSFYLIGCAMHARCVLIPWIFSVQFNEFVFVASHLDLVFFLSFGMADFEHRVSECKTQTHTHTFPLKVEKQLPCGAKITWKPQWQYTYNITENGNTDKMDNLQMNSTLNWRKDIMRDALSKRKKNEKTKQQHQRASIKQA